MNYKKLWIKLAKYFRDTERPNWCKKDLIHLMIKMELEEKEARK